MYKRYLSFIAVLLLFTFHSLNTVQAAPGTPESSEFGFGGWVDLKGQYLTSAVNTAAGMGMDWIAIEFDWAQTWSEPTVAPDLTALNQAMLLAQKGNLNVMMSITNPPGWIITASGPDPNLTASLVIGMKQLYPETLMAVELYPEANTHKGWGYKPDPIAYGYLLATTHNLLEKNNLDLFIVAAGLKPLTAGASADDINDLVFLDALYKSSPAPALSIISIRLPELTGSPMALPTQTEHRNLRHYEEVRQIMLQNNQAEGMIWITHFSWPSGNISPQDSIYLKAEEQASWLGQSYRLMRAQLYIGVAFFSKLNPSASAPATDSSSLILPNGSMHVSAEQMSKLVFMSGSIKSVVFEGNISKRTPEKLVIKPNSP